MTPVVLFSFEYALASLLISKGIQPYAMIGHSLGEYVAACLSGVFDLRDALKLVSIRGRLMTNLPEGIMMSVPLPAEQLATLITENLSIAADHGESCIVAGAT